jgi:subtilisin family serine protease/subtilase family serine protease
MIDFDLRVTQCARRLLSRARTAPAQATTAATAPMAASLRHSLLALLAAVPLALSTHVMAGSPFGPVSSDSSIDLSAAGAKAPKRDRETREGEILVRFKASVPTATRDAKHGKKGNLKLRELKRSGVHQVGVSPDQTLDAAVASYRADPDVEYAEPNFALRALLTPNEPSFNLLWGLNNTGQTLGTPGVDIRASAAWDITTGSNTVVVMVIDSGADYTHPDLAANMWVNPGEIPGNGIDDDGNGYIDDVRGIDVVNGDADPMDDFGHGTHVAGTIGAVGNNALGVVGVNWNVKILPCRILDSTGNGTIADAIVCLEYARALKASGVNIVATNNSYGGLSAFSQTMYDAINAQRDILFIAAAGNSGLDNDTVDFYPADFNLPNVISVAATDHTDAMASFSHFGRRSVHVAAPGVNIWSTLNFNSYQSASGTSMAAPHVAGLAALLKAQDPTRDWRALKNLILSGADAKPSLAGKTVSGGRLNAFNGVSCVSRPLFSVVTVPAAFVVGTANTVSALSINCGNAVGPVTATTSSGQSFSLLDDGVAPDLAAGDGLFTATWTPSQAFAFIDFTSLAGTERLGAVDLTLTTVSAPASANRGDTVALSATVSNPSSTAAPASTVNFYLSVDGIITTADTLVGSVTVPALAAGTQQVLAADASIPATLAVGNYFVGAVVDPANAIGEGDETNNARAGNVVAISNFATDLIATAVAGPATAFTGDVATVSVTVRNLGTTAAPASTLYLFVASNPAVSGTYVLIGQPSVGALAGGAQQIVSGSYPIPVTLPPGTYTIVAQADGPNSIIETNEANNTGVGNLMTTSTRNVDLTLTSVTSPTTAKNGASISLSANVKNLGTASAPASTIRWYLSTDSTITTADIPLASVSTAALNAGSSRSVSVTTTVPVDVAAGSYRIGAIVDPDNLVAETNETNNARVSTSTTAVSYTADLVMTAVSGPTSGATGQNVTFTGTLANQGAAAVNKPIKVGFYLSTGTTISTNDKLIATTTVASLGGNSSIPVSLTVTLRTDLSAGTYYVGAIADYDALVAESNNNNNTKLGSTMAVSYGPDLVMTAVAAPATGTRGSTVTVTGTLVNQGVGALGSLSDMARLVAGTIRVGFYLSSNATITANDTRIGTVTLSSIPAGASVPLSVSALIPAGLARGSYYIGVIADDTSALRESSELNNARAGNIVNVQ